MNIPPVGFHPISDLTYYTASFVAGGTKELEMPGREPTTADLSAKLVAIPKRAKDELVRKVALLYAVMTHPDTPAWVKALIIAALLYLLNPLDAVPDVIPIAGLADDIAVLAAALKAVSEAASRPKVKERAAELVSRFSGRGG